MARSIKYFLQGFVEVYGIIISIVFVGLAAMLIVEEMVFYIEKLDIINQQELKTLQQQLEEKK